jgi:hypothetical protein
MPLAVCWAARADDSSSAQIVTKADLETRVVEKNPDWNLSGIANLLRG